MLITTTVGLTRCRKSWNSEGRVNAIVNNQLHAQAYSWQYHGASPYNVDPRHHQHEAPVSHRSKAMGLCRSTPGTREDTYAYG